MRHTGCPAPGQASSPGRYRFSPKGAMPAWSLLPAWCGSLPPHGRRTLPGSPLLSACPVPAPPIRPARKSGYQAWARGPSPHAAQNAWEPPGSKPTIHNPGSAPFPPAVPPPKNASGVSPHPTHPLSGPGLEANLSAYSILSLCLSLAPYGWLGLGWPKAAFPQTGNAS